LNAAVYASLFARIVLQERPAGNHLRCVRMQIERSRPSRAVVWSCDMYAFMGSLDAPH
jgi:hypothetical protein